MNILYICTCYKIHPSWNIHPPSPFPEPLTTAKNILMRSWMVQPPPPPQDTQKIIKVIINIKN